MSNTPLPPIVERADEHYHGEGLADAVHAHAAAVTREKDARIKVLEDALRGVMSGCKYSRIADEWHWHEKSMPTNAALNAARAALGDSAPTTPPPSPSPRS